MGLDSQMCILEHVVTTKSTRRPQAEPAMSEGQIEDQYEKDYEDTYREKSSGGGCLKGCLIAGAICLVLFVVLGIWVYSNLRNWAADFGSFVVNSAIDQTELPAQEKEEIKVQVARVTDAVREGSLSDQQLETIMKGLIDSPLMSVIMVMGLEKKYFDKSGLEEAEKEEGRVALRRLMRGTINGDIEETDFDEPLSKIADRQPDDTWKLRDSVTDEQLRELFQLAKQKADEAGVPEEVEEVDPSDEMRRIIDDALGEAPAEEAAGADEGPVLP